MRRHSLHGKAWLVIAGVFLLVILHTALFGLALRGHRRWIYATGALALVVTLKYLWSRRRRISDPGAS